MNVKLFVVVVTACLYDLCFTKTTLYCKRQARTGFQPGSKEGQSTKSPLATRPAETADPRNTNDHCCSGRPMPSQTYTCCVGERVYKETHRCCPWDSKPKKLKRNDCTCALSFAELQKHFQNVNSTLAKSKQLLKDLAEKESNVAAGYVKYYGDISKALEKLLRKLGMSTLEKAFKVIKCSENDEMLTQNLVDVILTTSHRDKILKGMETASRECWNKIEDDSPAGNPFGMLSMLTGSNDDSDVRQEVEEYINEVQNRQKPHLTERYEITCIIAPLANQIRSLEWLLSTIEKLIQELEERALQDETEQFNFRSTNSLSTKSAGCIEDNVNKVVNDTQTYYDHGSDVLSDGNKKDACDEYWTIDPRPASIRPTGSSG